ncbi:MAG: sensor histidine kinase [Solirubrobacterales bacterium]
MNKLLLRQLKKSLGNGYSVPEELHPLFAAVSTAYDDFDADRRLIERALDVSSEELTEINHRLRSEIGERETAEKELKRSVSLLAATLESTADGILVVDREGRIRGFNGQFVALWSIPESVLASQRDDLLLSFVADQLQDPQGFLSRVQELYNDPAAEDHAVLEFKDGRVFERYSKAQYLDGQVVGRVWSFRDVTERVQAAQTQNLLIRQFEDTNERLAKVNEELDSFAYVVSHDLKAPLRGIKTLAEWIVEDCADRIGEDGKEQLRLMLDRIQRMHDLIDGILQYSKIGRVQEQRAPVDIEELVPQVVDLLAPPEHITVAIRDRLPVVTCDRVRIMQVFQNLLSNAIKYMDKPRGFITVGCTGDPEQWTFSVSDNGPGIDEKYHEKIFGLFQTLSPRDEYDSTGIGLTLVKRIVELYEGRIWVESRLGEGCTFFFTLPRTREESCHERLPVCTAG